MIMARLTLFITIILNFFLLNIILYNAKKSKVYVILASHIAAIILWALFILVNIVLPDYLGNNIFVSGDIVYFFEKIIFASATLVIIMQFWFAFIFAGRTFGGRFADYLLIIFQAVIIALCFVNGALFNKIIILPSGGAILEMGRFSLLYSIFIFLHIIYSLFILSGVRKRASDSVSRGQAGILVLIYSLFLFISLILNWLLPVYFNIFDFNAYGPTLSLVMVVGVLYAISHYRFLEIRAIIQRGFIYSIIFSLIVAAYLSLIFAFGYFFRLGGGTTTLFSAGLMMLLGIYGVPQIERFFRRVTDKIFFKGRYDLGPAMAEFSAILNRKIDLDELFRGLSEAMRTFVRVADFNIVLFEEGTIHGDNASNINVRIFTADLKEALNGLGSNTVVFYELPYLIKNKEGAVASHSAPVLEALKKLDAFGKDAGVQVAALLRAENNLIGMMIFGSKLSGDPYSMEDLQLIESVSYQAATALEKARLYNKVKEYSLDLEEKVRQRTSQIQALQEEQQMVMLEISHELQTPLTIIKNDLDQICKLDPKNKKMGIFAKSVEKLSNFVYELLTLAKMENDSRSFSMSRTGLSDLLFEIAEYLEVVMADKNIRIETDIEPGIFIDGDAKKIEQMITNLASNAAKYMDENKEKLIRISLSRSGRSAVLRVGDNGIGIAPENIDKLFRRFYRADTSSGRTGTGLGLSICRVIAEKHGGRISAESKFGEGTVFTVVLPALGDQGDKNKTVITI